MLRHNYSYWLTAEPAKDITHKHTLKELLDALQKSNLAGDEHWTCMVFGISDGQISGEVNPHVGTIEESRDLVETVSQIAAQFPDFDFTFLENDEEDKSVAIHTTWHNGQQVRQGHKRVVEPDMDYDPVTLKAVISHLNMHGFVLAANVIKHDFPEAAED